MGHQTEHPGRNDARRKAPDAAHPPGKAHPLAHLQRSAGNRAVTDALVAGSVPVQRFNIGEYKLRDPAGYAALLARMPPG